MLSRALDVGCSVGRTTFELSKTYDEVLGIDFSRAFVSKCQQLKVTGQTSYFLVSEGLLGEEKTASIDPAIVSIVCATVSRVTCLMQILVHYCTSWLLSRIWIDCLMSTCESSRGKWASSFLVQPCLHFLNAAALTMLQIVASK